MGLTISAIIVNFNAGALLRTSVNSILNCSLDIEVIVIDNASIDSSLNTLQDLPNVQIVRNSKNRGFAAACNQGIELAKADNLLFLNPDCSFSPGMMAELLKILRENSDVGMVGGNLVNADGTEQRGGRRAVPTPWRTLVRTFGLAKLSNRWPKLFYDFYLHKQPLPKNPIEVEAISGACMLVKREAIDDVGQWDDEYFLHCEDLDWCMRFRLKGWKILFVPTAIITHEQGACGRDRPIFVEWHKHKGMVRFYNKFFRHQYPGVLMWLVAFGVWLRFSLKAIYFTIKQVMNAFTSNEVKAMPAEHVPVQMIAKGEARQVGVLGATSFVGGCLLPLLEQGGWQVTAFSRNSVNSQNNSVTWRQLPVLDKSLSLASRFEKNNEIPFWICVTPIWILPDYFEFLETQGVQRLVVVSSTSRFTKDDSSDPEERALALRFANAESSLIEWAGKHGVEWVILRPTLIYGLGQDKNITEIARLIRRFGFFPLFGKAKGLRQPIHAQDVASACVAALQVPEAANRAYNISGGETISYHDMVIRVFSKLEHFPLLITVPLWVFRLIVAMLRLLPRYRKWSSAMAERMDKDLVFDHNEAARDLGFKPRRFELSSKDLPPSFSKH